MPKRNTRYSGHLLPELRGKIYPIRTKKSVQETTAEFGNQGHKVAWSAHGGGSYDAKRQIKTLGLLYSNQNPLTGDIFIGSESTNVKEIVTSDDATVGASNAAYLSGILPTLFKSGWSEGAEPVVKKIWTGIMRFTEDRLPIIGQLPQEYTKRGEEGGEWIAAGFNGYGMAPCWSSGEAVAKMMLGIDVSDFLPEVFLATREQLGDETRMDPNAVLNRFIIKKKYQHKF